ncbi:hypothetical protein ABTY63_09785 [Streptomyces solisilvae]|uniref:hypothetical protein n=1 Tax=Streptomyces malaysiensis TaxID=92644 RepID=UPI0033185B87
MRDPVSEARSLGRGGHGGALRRAGHRLWRREGGSADADGSSGTTPTPSATAPAPSSSELDELNRLVDGAESAADKADSDAANDH